MTREHRIIARLLAITDRCGTSPDSTGQRHLDNRENLNHLGVCCQRRTWHPSAEVVPDGSGFRPASHTLTGACAPSCLEWQEAQAEAHAYLAECQPVQMRLEAVS